MHRLPFIYEIISNTVLTRNQFRSESLMSPRPIGVQQLGICVSFGHGCRVCGRFWKVKSFYYNSAVILVGWNPLGVVHKGRPQKGPLFLLPTSCPQVSAFDQHPLPPLRTSAFSIIHCSMVWQCNSWYSQKTLLIGLVIGSFYPYPMWADMWVM